MIEPVTKMDAFKDVTSEDALFRRAVDDCMTALGWSLRDATIALDQLREELERARANDQQPTRPILRIRGWGPRRN